MFIYFPLMIAFVVAQVSKERVRVGEFLKDYDKLKSGRVSCITSLVGWTSVGLD